MNGAKHKQRLNGVTLWQVKVFFPDMHYMLHMLFIAQPARLEMNKTHTDKISVFSAFICSTIVDFSNIFFGRWTKE